jgi:putative membrane protein
MKFVVRLLINAVALWVATKIIPGISYEGGFVGLLLVALVFGVLNAFVRPILALLTCPLMVLTLGLFTLVLNAVMLLLTGAASDALGLSFFVHGLVPAILGGLVVSIVSVLLSVFVKDDNER